MNGKTQYERRGKNGRIWNPTLRLLMGHIRTCLHKKCVRIFEHNFVADKAKIRRRAVARQEFLTQSAAKFAEKTCAYACEDRFLIFHRCSKVVGSKCLSLRSVHLLTVPSSKLYELPAGVPRPSQAVLSLTGIFYLYIWQCLQPQQNLNKFLK